MEQAVVKIVVMWIIFVVVATGFVRAGWKDCKRQKSLMADLEDIKFENPDEQGLDPINRSLDITDKIRIDPEGNHIFTEKLIEIQSNWERGNYNASERNSSYDSLEQLRDGYLEQCRPYEILGICIILSVLGALVLIVSSFIIYDKF